jgi:DNA-binding transcriptional LysR family regulator
MTLQQIRYVIGIADCGSFNRASEKLFVSQPSLTSAVHDLERELGFSVFNRSSKGVSLTFDGANFLADARSLYENYESILNKYIRRDEKKFSVSTLHYPFATKSFADIVRRFAPEGYSFEIREMKISRVVEDVFRRRSELGIIYLSETNRREILDDLDSKNLEFHHLTECNAFVFLHKNHPVAKKESLSLDDLANFPCIICEQEDLSSFFSRETLELPQLKKAVKTVDRATILNLVEELNGYTFSSGVVSEELSDDNFIAIPLKNLDENTERTFELGYITVKKSKISNIALCYIDKIRRSLHIAGFAC